MNLYALDENTWNLIRQWDLETLKMAAKMFEPVDDEDEQSYRLSNNRGNNHNRIYVAVRSNDDGFGKPIGRT